MNSSSCVATTLSPSERQELALQVLTKTEPVTNLAKEHQVSRKFLYQQSNKANDALEEAVECQPLVRCASITRPMDQSVASCLVPSDSDYDR